MIGSRRIRKATTKHIRNHCTMKSGRAVVILLMTILLVSKGIVSATILCDDKDGNCRIICERHCDEPPPERNVDSNGDGIPDITEPEEGDDDKNNNNGGGGETNPVNPNDNNKLGLTTVIGMAAGGFLIAAAAYLLRRKGRPLGILGGGGAAGSSNRSNEDGNDPVIGYGSSDDDDDDNNLSAVASVSGITPDPNGGSMANGDLVEINLSDEDYPYK